MYIVDTSKRLSSNHFIQFNQYQTQTGPTAGPRYAGSKYSGGLPKKRRWGPPRRHPPSNVNNINVPSSEASRDNREIEKVGQTHSLQAPERSASPATGIDQETIRSRSPGFWEDTYEREATPIGSSAHFHRDNRIQIQPATTGDGYIDVGNSMEENPWA